MQVLRDRVRRTNDDVALSVVTRYPAPGTRYKCSDGCRVL